MSLAKLKGKETKGKQKVLPKLKAILANPNKTKCPVLDEQEMDHLKCILQNAISKSKLEPRSYATHKNICLGLESSLRKINNKTSSCVFISLSIKPNYLISLIARNADIRDESQPVYAQPKLENFIEQIFGIQALCMVFPKNLEEISGDLRKWVDTRKRITKVKINISNDKPKKIKKSKTMKTSEIKMVEEKVPSADTSETLSGDFISFGKCDVEQRRHIRLDNDNAVDALSNIIDKIPTSSKIAPKTESMKVDEVHFEPDSLKDNTSESSDDFLGNYKALTVHKIIPNPNKNPRKRKKNKKQKVANK